MENKINRQTTNEEIDRLLEEQYDAETEILESALLKAAGKSSWEEFPEESEEEIQQGYDRLIARLKEKGEYRESAPENSDHKVSKVIGISGKDAEETEVVGKARKIKEVKESRARFDYEWNRTHRILKPAAAIVAAAMLTALIGMSVTADFQFSDMGTQAYYTAIPDKK